MNDYDYIAAVDCECEFVRSFQPGELMNDIWESKSFLTANKTPFAINALTGKCASLLGLDGEDSRVRRETEEYRYYWWFNEIPVYRTDTLKDFFSWLNENSRRDAVFNNWCCFDYLVYVMWLIECRGFTLKRLGLYSQCGITEGLYKRKYAYRRLERDCGFHWTTREKVRPEDSKVVMKFHLDHLKDYRSFCENSSMYVRFKFALKDILISLGLWRED